MWWQLWGSPQPGKLSDKVQKALIVQFGLDRERVDGLRCVQKSAKLNGRPIRNIRVFDPAQLGPKSPPIRRYEDLESRLDAVLFDGYIEKFGLAHLSEAQPSGDAGLQKLPDALRSALVTRYSVDPREVGELRWVQKPGTLADKDIRLVRIFDPRTLTLGAPNIRTYDGLDSYPELVQFQGHIDGNNALYLSNRSTQDLSASPESG